MPTLPEMHLRLFSLALLLTLFVVTSTAMNPKPSSSKLPSGEIPLAEMYDPNTSPIKKPANVRKVQPIHEPIHEQTIPSKEMFKEHPNAQLYDPESLLEKTPTHIPILKPTFEKEKQD